MKRTIILLLLTIFIASCDKDKKVTDDIDGVWSIDQKIYTETSVSLENAGTFTFHNCVQDSCTGVLLNENGIEVAFSWFITAKGTTINVKSADPNAFLVKGIYSIESLKNEKLLMSYEQLGKPISFELTRTGDV
ncbi:MAG: hypothetical protein HRT71_10745 [Flavobacteriales bacterium]|nr:hypothetical protein [Flavobacteriales bacterium]